MERKGKGNKARARVSLLIAVYITNQFIYIKYDNSMEKDGSYNIRIKVK